MKAKEESPARQLDAFLAKFDPKTRSLIKAARAVLRRRWPAAHELVWDNYNFFVIGYSTTERPSHSIVAIAAAANGVGISFYRGASLPDPKHVLLGSGAQNRFIRLESVATLARPEVRALLDAAAQQERPPFAKGQRGRLIIRSISAKQRPRRKAAAQKERASRG
ncbi:MAG TPA: hypothetical protein VGR66_13115 [Candidatus Eisenbacteria bacterium]|jgi:hypothetical protein|nr:hypothetical protein [Candidatus Eisenbacteria bacterium]